jgi:hypothetical protein
MINRRSEQFNWGSIISSAALGLALLALAHLTALVWNWPNVTTGVIGSLGAAFLLVFVLFLFERRFTRNVAERVKEAAETVITAGTQSLGIRLDDLEERLNARRAATETVQDEAVDAIAANVSFDTISTALAEAERVGAIRGGALTCSSRSAAMRETRDFDNELIQGFSPACPSGGWTPRPGSSPPPP